MIISIEEEVKQKISIPTVPNFVVVDGKSIDIKDLKINVINKIAEAWRKNFLEKAGYQP